ncbi:DUF2971 domain-containing protein [Olivibacter sp. LS-1]|uniref:DUF2971 domain-containing protein n=1 Tax=Olivibacter sp. LS-1 TaxID=2592345 RepID=UPI0011EB243C|nr:DUF2971 domain-containing protein [Olivibacter sp. LS-1]QEL03442.1 DUF2971 domain-containing protein [Olivibacter sp. LS-1]
MKVYKYRSVATNILDRDIKTFSANQFFAPKFETLNDPFEATFNELLSNTLAQWKNLTLASYDLEQRLQDVFKYKDKVGIFSLSKTYDSTQMWAYYASDHEGYCIEYDLQKLKDLTKNKDFSKELDVQYSDHIPTLEYKDLKDGAIYQKMFGMKTLLWKHEQEIRLIFDHSSLKNHHPSAITAVYFGTKANNELIKLFQDHFANRDICFYKMILNKSKRQMERVLHRELKRKASYDLSKTNFSVIKHQDNAVVENYYIHMKDDLSQNELLNFAKAFKGKYCYKPSNLNFFNTSEIADLIGRYPLNEEDYIKYAEAYTAAVDFSSDEFISEFPYKDFRYKELKNHS